MPYAVTPLASKSYKFTQSRYDDVPVLPMRALCLAPSGSGKSVLLQRMITDIFDGCFAAGVHIFSHSINIDDTWTPVKQWMEKNNSVDSIFGLFKTYSANSEFYLKVSKPLLSMRTLGSMVVERRIKPIKHTILTKKHNHLQDPK